MSRYFIILIFITSSFFGANCQTKPVLVIHGGAGTLTKANMTPEKEKAYHEALSQALKLGYNVLENGGSSTEAVIVAIQFLEDSPLFNAGKGAVLNAEGIHELDASIMDGKTKKAGAVSGLLHIKNPIKAAWEVMEHSEHVMLTGSGAEKFAKERGLEWVDQSYFTTEERYQQWLKAKEKKTGLLNSFTDYKFGTVGAVALDQYGNLSAGTSTGGMTFKQYGRIGDSPIIGAGTYAENESCAVSATGWGEFFIRSTVAHDVCSRMKYLKIGVEFAAKDALQSMADLGGDGGLIALDKNGNFTFQFNTEGMYRGFINERNKAQTFIYQP